MKHLMTALGVEVLKLKRTLAVTLTAVVPLVVAVLQFCSMLQRARYGIHEADDPWGVLSHNMLLIYSLLMLPLFITLQTALLAGLEHNAKAWKRLYALPIPRSAIYFAKQIVTLGLIGLSMAVLVALMPVVGVILQAIEPRFALALDAIPWVASYHRRASPTRRRGRSSRCTPGSPRAGRALWWPPRPASWPPSQGPWPGVPTMASTTPGQYRA